MLGQLFVLPSDPATHIEDFRIFEQGQKGRINSWEHSFTLPAPSDLSHFFLLFPSKKKGVKNHNFIYLTYQKMFFMPDMQWDGGALWPHVVTRWKHCKDTQKRGTITLAVDPQKMEHLSCSDRWGSRRATRAKQSHKVNLARLWGLWGNVCLFVCLFIDK